MRYMQIASLDKSMISHNDNPLQTFRNEYHDMESEAAIRKAALKAGVYKNSSTMKIKAGGRNSNENLI